MKNLLFAALLFGSLFAASCTKCTTCDVSIDQSGAFEKKRYTYEKCGTRKEINDFKEDLDSLKAYYDSSEVTIICTDK